MGRRLEANDRYIEYIMHITSIFVSKWKNITLALQAYDGDFARIYIYTYIAFYKIEARKQRTNCLSIAVGK